MADLEIVVRARDQLTAELRRMGQTVRDLGRQMAGDLNTAGASTQGIRTGAASATTEVRKLTTGVRETTTALAGAAAGAGRMDAAFAGVKRTVLTLVPALGLAGAAFAGQRAVSDALALDNALDLARIDAKLTAAELDELRQGSAATARALGLSDAKTAPAILAAVGDGARSAADGLARFAASAKLAEVTGADLTRTVDILGSTVNAYRDQGLTAAQASDVLFQIAREGKTSIDELAGSLDPVLLLASQMGARFEDLGAVIIATTEKGGGFTQGMQAVRSILQTLADASPEVKAALSGIEFDQTAIKARGLVPVLRDVAERLDGNAAAIRAIFPDGRSFAALLATLRDGGAGLTRALEGIRGSAGGVEQALGERLQRPAKQLSILANELRSSFGQAFGGALLASIRTAIGEFGGAERAVGAAAAAGSGLGKALGVALPALTTAAAEIADIAIDIASKFEGSGERIREFGTAGAVIVRVLADGFRELLVVVGTTIELFQAVSTAMGGGGTIFGGLDEEELDSVNAALLQTSALLTDLATVPSPDVGGVIERFEAINKLKTALEALPDDVEVDIPVNFDEASVRELRSQLDAVFGAEQASVGLRSALSSIGDKFVQETKNIGESVNDAIATGIADARRSADQGEPLHVEVDFAAAQEQVRFFEGELDRLRVLAGEELSLGGLNPITANEIQEVALRLGSARKKADEFGEALARSVETDISLQSAELARVEAAAREAAEALGFEVPNERANELRQTIEGLRAQLRGLRGEAEIGETPKIEAPPPLDLTFEELLGFDIEDVRAFGQRVTRELAGAVEAGDVRVAEFMFSQRDQAEIVLRAHETAEKMVGEFDRLEELRGKIGEALTIDDTGDFERARRDAIALADAVSDLAIKRGRFQGEALKERADLRAWAIGLVNAAENARILERDTGALGERLGGLPTDVVFRIAALGIDEMLRAFDELQGEIAVLRGTAIALEVEIEGLTPKQIQDLIDDARAQVDRANLAISLGLKLEVSDLELGKAAEAAQKGLARAQAEIGRAQLEREAFHFGVELDPNAPEKLQEQVERARGEAQAYADALRGRGIRGEALSLGIGIDQQSPDELERQIAEAQVAAQEFARQNPLLAEGITTGIRGAAAAFGQIASGAQSAKEAFADFGRAAIQQLVQLAFQMAIVRSLFAAFGTNATGGLTGFGSFLTSQFGLARGLVMPAAHGIIYGDSPGMAVQRFALGGSPNLDRIVGTPTIEPASRLAGMAIVPLFGGGVETPDGRRLPVAPGAGGELAVVRPHALGGAPAGEVRALYGEAGAEAVMRVLRGPGGAPGIRASDGGVMPLQRVAGGRLGVEDRRYALGGLPVAYARGGVQSQVAAPISVSISVPVNVQGGSTPAQGDLEQRIQSRFARSKDFQDLVVSIVQSEISARPGLRSAVRGDRV